MDTRHPTRHPPRPAEAEPKPESAAAPPPTSPSTSPSTSPRPPPISLGSASSYFTYPISHVVDGLYRRLITEPTTPEPTTSAVTATSTSTSTSTTSTTTATAMPPSPSSRRSGHHPPFSPPVHAATFSGPYSTTTTASSAPFSNAPPPFNNPHPSPPSLYPPPLTPLTLDAVPPPHAHPPAPSARILSPALAEEIRLLLPPRLQLADAWLLAYSLDRDGASLGTLYESARTASARWGGRGGFVLVIKDASGSTDGDGGGGGGGGWGSGGGGSGSVFGAYLSDPPHPAPHYYGNGECFLWRASMMNPPSLTAPAVGSRDTEGGGKEAPLLDLSGLPPPPSADTEHLGRSTTFPGGGADPTERIRFKAFPYSGINDYMMFCETGFLSVGGGDGHFGLWLDDSLETGVSSPSLTFGNEPLSDQGTKFEVLGVELWYIG